jgi:hypothetical protein
VNSPFDRIRQFEEQVGLPENLFLYLPNEDDWSFVIKLHALFEGAATHVLSIRIGGGCLEEELSHLDFAHPRFGKTRLLRRLGVINAPQAKFLQLLSETRNRLVHSVQNVAFSFDEHVEAMDENQFAAFCDKVALGQSGPVSIHDKEIPRHQFVSENPKLCIWLAASDVLACICVEEDFAEIEERQRSMERAQIEFYERFSDVHKTALDALKIGGNDRGDDLPDFFGPPIS